MHGIQALIENQIIIKEKKLKVSIKKTIAHHTAKISLLDRLNVKFSNTEWHKQELANKCRYKNKIFKIKKEYVFKQRHKSKCMVVCTVLPHRERIDQDFIKVKFRNRKHF